ncbi:MAG: hypothetical protein JJU11_05905, partial [Candidatus Sumerlaeia bacterium]|nr:hypothetical protein [Candidatus Sumerlaeia bacterium]
MKRLVAAWTAIPLMAAALISAPATAEADVFLQYFEARWETIERRMPDVFAAGYSGVWVPPPSLADSGGFSVGYDVFDRFNFGSPNNRTLYGTTQGFEEMAREMRRAGIGIYVDTILNHNGFRDHTSPGFEENGGYPGFVTSLPWDQHGDFHDPFLGGDLQGRLAGLIDIAQDKDYRFVRHPVPGFENNIPNEIPREENRRLYPDRDLPADFMGRHPFNLGNPMAGDPVEENSTGLLMRYMQWLVQVHGVTGFRLDATKHKPTWFYNDFYDAAIFELGVDPITGDSFTPFSFGEAFTGDFGQLAAYVRKDGFGNRDTLDFPLYFAMDSVFGAGGFGSMRDLEFASFDGVDGNANSGTFGVMFAGSHDENYAGRGQGLDNVALAHILTRTGLPIVYYNAREFGDGRDFPRDGRGDSLGNFGSVITTLLRINQTHIKGAHFTRWIDDDVYIYERNQSAIIGMTDRRDGGFAERGIQTSFPPGTLLHELTGHANADFVDPFNDIPETITVGSDGRVSFRVPHNTRPGSSLEDGGFHGLGYVVYGPKVPDSTLEIVNATTTIGPDPTDRTPESTRRLTTLYVVEDDVIEIMLTVPNDADAPNDNALIKVNFGEVDVNGNGSVITGGEFRGFDEFQQVDVTDTARVYTATIDATSLAEGYTYIETVAFLQRPAGTPPLYDVQRRVVYLDRLPPEVDLRFPPQSGDGDITSRDYEAVIAVDYTVDSAHLLLNADVNASDEEILALVNDDNRARRHDRREFRRVLSGLPNGTITLTVVAFEETGTYTIEHFGNIAVDVPLPNVVLGVDTNPDRCCVTFTNVPEFINSSAMEEEFVVRVQTVNIDGMGRNISFPQDFTVSIQVDDGPVIQAVPYDESL